MIRNNRFIHTGFLLLMIFFAWSVYAQEAATGSNGSSSGLPFMVKGDQLAIWDGRDYVPVFVKGINLGVSIPGTQPGQLAASAEDYQRWFHLIKEAGYNVIRIYTLHFPRFYEELKFYNETHKNNPLFVLHGVWLEEQETASDLYNLTNVFDQEIRDVVSAVHGDITIDIRLGKAYGTFDSDISQWVMGYLIGREIFPSEVALTNEAHPADTLFSGSFYFFSEGVDPVEVWIAERIDNLAIYENDLYGVIRPVGVSTWPTLDPLIHPTEQQLPGSSEDIEQIDLSNFHWADSSGGFFIGYHAYPYYPDFINQDPDYAVESDGVGPNNYLGYLKDLKNHYHDIPLIIAEFGLPSSWGSGHLSPTGMHHGGITEGEQGEYAIRMMDNIKESNCAGGIQFSLIDEWFKQTWITNPYSDSRYRPFWHNITSPEQNFGILSYTSPPGTYSRVGNYPGKDIEKINAYADFDFLRIRAFLKSEEHISDTLWVAFDTYLKEMGESLLPDGRSLGSATDTLRAEFLLMIPLGSDHASLYVIPSYDIFGIKNPVRVDTVISGKSDTGDWNIVRWKTNYFYHITQYLGKLNISGSEDPYQFLNAVTIFNDSLEIRIPWTLINFYAPNKRRVMHYQSYLENDEIKFISKDSLSDGVAFTFFLNEELYQTSRFLWDDWEYDRIVENPPLERKKLSFHFLKQNLPLFNNVPIGLADTFRLLKDEVLNVDPLSGLLSNDFDIDGNIIYANLSFGNSAFNGEMYLHPDGSFQYIPEQGFVGNDYFMYFLDDGEDYSSLIPVNIFVDAAEYDRTSLAEEEGVTVFPNPGVDRFTIQSRVFMTDVKLSIYDISGRLFEEVLINGYETEIYLEDATPGIYLFKFISGNHSEIHKVIIKSNSK